MLKNKTHIVEVSEHTSIMQYAKNFDFKNGTLEGFTGLLKDALADIKPLIEAPDRLSEEQTLLTMNLVEPITSAGQIDQGKIKTLFEICSQFDSAELKKHISSYRAPNRELTKYNNDIIRSFSGCPIKHKREEQIQPFNLESFSRYCQRLQNKLCSEHDSKSTEAFFNNQGINQDIKELSHMKEQHYFLGTKGDVRRVDRTKVEKIYNALTRMKGQFTVESLKSITTNKTVYDFLYMLLSCMPQQWREKLGINESRVQAWSDKSLLHPLVDVLSRNV